MTVRQATRYRERYIGLAADVKPSGVAVGARFYATDTQITYIWDGDSWEVLPNGMQVGGTGG